MKDKVIFALKILFLVLIVAWVSIVITDYFNARNGDDPKFCLKEKIHVYNASGNLVETISKTEFNKEQSDDMLYTYECLGLGYKVYQYHRDFSAIEFGPFFISERQSAN